MVGDRPNHGDRMWATAASPWPKNAMVVNMLKSPVLIRIRSCCGQILSTFPGIWHWLGPAWLTCQFMVFPQSALFGQSLRLSSASASRGDQVAIELSLESPAGKEPLALQWDTKIPIAQVSLLNDQILVGPTAQEVGKSLNCALKEKTAETHTSRCILAGGQSPISNGAIAILRLKISMNARSGSARIRVEQGIAVSKDLKQAPLDAVETVVAIRR